MSETSDGAAAFPHPSYALASGDSDALDLVGLAMGYATLYALTDANNRDVGGSQPARVFFDGDPFPADDQVADGEATLHDRALAIMRVAIVDLDRMHVHGGVVVDRPTGHTVSATTAAYALIGLRTVLRSLDSQLELYSNNTPDTAIVATPLDAQPIHFPGDDSLTFTARVDQILRAHADLLLDHLTDATGRAFAGWDVDAAAPIDDSDTLDAHAAAVRGLFAAYLATGDVRGIATARSRCSIAMDAVFYEPDARIYAVTAIADVVTYTPLRFALVQSALRDIYELVASRPGGEAREPVIEARLARLNKLVLNGWDDRNGDQILSSADECANVVDGLPRGGLQMAERALTGELGRLSDEHGGGPATADRDSDCVPEIDDAHLPSALADSITFRIAR